MPAAHPKEVHEMLVFPLRDFGTTFGTRERGAELREAVLARAPERAGGVRIDFDEVTNVSYSFADEFVGKLAADLGADMEVELVNMRESVSRTVLSARERRTEAIAC
jgi:hypothetical protein